MADLNEEVEIKTTLTDEDGALLTPASVILTLTDPAGVETTPTVNNPAEGEYVVIQSLDQVGRWLWRWTTNTPDGVEWGFVDVGADPPARLLPLASIGDLEARIGTLTPAQAARAPALLEDASGLVRAETRLSFSVVTDDVLTIRSTGTVIHLPKRPVTSVTSVVAIGVPPVADLTLPTGSWVFDGIDRIILTSSPDWIINLPETWVSGDHPTAGTYRVTYSHGDATIPQEIRGLVAHMTNRTLTAPAVSDLVSQSIGGGDYAWQANQAVGAMGVAVRLTAGDRAKLESWGYIRDGGTTETPVR